MNSRRKGVAGERELVGRLREWLGPLVRRCWERAQAGGHDLDVPGWAGEVKRYKAIALHRWFDQAVEQAVRHHAGTGEVLKPVLFHREDRGEWLVTVRLLDWVELAREGIVGYDSAMGSTDAEERDHIPREDA